MAMENFSFTILAKDKKSKARTGIIKTSHGKIETPYLFPIATRGSIIALTPKDVAKINPQAILANTYHLHFKSPGDKIIKKQGGLHKVMHFKGPIITDSGGFQALSLGKGKVYQLRKVGFFPKSNKIQQSLSPSFAKMTKKGIIFTSVYDENKKELITPKISMQIQSNLGSDLIMAFDQCNAPGETKKETKEVMLRSHEWELESLKFHNKSQALYGIIHGGIYKDLRQQSAKFISSHDFKGIAIGGYMGKTAEELYQIVDWLVPFLDSRPIHLLGVGRVEDLFEGVSRGIDTFDCVETTRIARHGELYISPKAGGNKANKFHLKISQSKYKNDPLPPDPHCPCSTCKKYSRSDLRQLMKNKDLLFGKLATIHNITFTENLCKEIRTAIKQGTFQKMKKQWLR